MIVEQPEAKADLELRIQAAVAADDEIHGLVDRDRERRRLVDQRGAGRLAALPARSGERCDDVSRGAICTANAFVSSPVGVSVAVSAARVRQRRPASATSQKLPRRDFERAAALGREVERRDGARRFQARVQLRRQVEPAAVSRCRSESTSSTRSGAPARAVPSGIDRMKSARATRAGREQCRDCEQANEIHEPSTVRHLQHAVADLFVQHQLRVVGDSGQHVRVT